MPYYFGDLKRDTDLENNPNPQSLNPINLKPLLKVSCLPVPHRSARKGGVTPWDSTGGPLGLKAYGVVILGHLGLYVTGR